jgi:hypothetical protein
MFVSHVDCDFWRIVVWFTCEHVHVCAKYMYVQGKVARVSVTVQRVH